MPKIISFLIIRRKKHQQNHFGFYRSGIKKEQKWYGLEIPYLDFRLVIYKKRKKLKSYPIWVCYKCGINASNGQSFKISTWHKGKCGVCEKIKSVTQPRDYYYPKFEGYKN